LVTNIETNLAERFKKHHKSEDEFCDWKSQKVE
jgi:hypothetical protein